MPSYPAVNLEGPPEDAPTPEPAPVVGYRAHRDAWASDGPCTVCGEPCSTFADAIHADGSVSGWVRVCGQCRTPADAPTPEAAEVDAEPSDA